MSRGLTTRGAWLKRRWGEDACMSMQQALERIAECRATRSTELDLSGLGLLEIPAEVADLVWLERLELSNNQISRIEGLERISGLIELYLSYNEISRIEGLQGLTNLKGLDLSDNQISWIEGLEALSNLTVLHLSHNQIRRIEGLDSLLDLANLNLSYNQISQIEGLGCLTSLTDLGLFNNKICRIEGLTCLLGLTDLNLSNNQISQIEGLESLTSLADLNLSNNQISRIEGLESLTDLKAIKLWFNQICRIEGLDSLTGLTALYLFNNKIHRIEGLDSLLGLTVLYLSGNQICRIEGLEHLMDLTVLGLSNNQISKIEGLEGLTGLAEISLSGNQISRIEALESLKGLIELHLSHNQISRIEGLECLTGLTELHLSANQISRVEGLECLTGLALLYLSHNQISRVAGLERLTGLTTLNLSHNQISQVDDLKATVTLPALERLRIEDTPVLQQCGLVLSTDYSANHLETIKSFVKQKHIRIKLPRRVMLLGNHAAGKSSLLHYIQHEVLPTKSHSTHGLQVQRFTLPKQHTPSTDSEQLDQTNLPDAVLFDFGGQDYYHGMYRLFLRQQSSQIIVVNPSHDRNQTCDENAVTVASPQSTQDFSLAYWAAQLQYFRPEPAQNTAVLDTLLVQSHADCDPIQRWHYAECVQDRLLRFDHLSLKPSQQASDFKLRQFREALLQHIDSSRDSVYQTERRIKLIQHVLSIWDSLQASYRPLKVDRLNVKLNGKKYSLDWFKIDLEQMSAAGLVWYDQQIAAGYVWLNPKALVDDLHQRLLSPKLLRERHTQGILSQADLNTLKLHPATIELLQFYRVIFKHQPDQYDDQQVDYIIPNYLPLCSEQSALYSLSTFGLDQATFRMRFVRFMPMGLINQVVCFFGRQPDHKLFWRDLLVFTFSNDVQGRYRVMIRLDFTALEIHVCIQPSNLNANPTEYRQVKQYVFYCLMRFYWDLHATDGEPASFEHFVAVALRHEPDLKVQKLHPTEEDLANPSSQYRFGRPLWSPFYVTDPDRVQPEQARFIPEDLYLSVGATAWVKYSDLVKHPADEPLIQRNELQDGMFKLQGTIPAKPFEVFLNRELRAVKKIFISYSRKDLQYKDELSLFLKTTLGSHGHQVWDCGMLEEGKWDEQIQNKLAESDLVIFMLSINFFASGYIEQKELINTLAHINQPNSKQKIMCIVVKKFPWDSFAALAKASKVAEQDMAFLKDVYESPRKEDITDYQFLPYWRHRQQGRDELEERLTPLAQLSDADRDEVYSDIVGRVMNALKIT